jgi:hypothetical protein
MECKGPPSYGATGDRRSPTGKKDEELVNLLRGEPDPALFLPPDGYEFVINEMVVCKE